MAAKAKTREGYGLIKQSVTDFIEDDCMSSAAALAYYTIFSLPPILLIILMTVQPLLQQTGQKEGKLEQQLQQQAGLDKSTIAEVEKMAQNARKTGTNPLSAAIGIAVLLFSATGAFAQLQYSLNRAWEVRPDPNAGGIKNFLMKRVLSLGMILVIAFLVLVSIAITTVLSAMGELILPGGFPKSLSVVLNNLMSLLIMTLLFAGMFKVLPDSKVTWRSVWVGALFTAILFVIGKALIGFYLSMSNMDETYGAAGALVAVLVWVYYSSLIVLLGAEFTQAWARRYGEQIVPSKGAVRVVRDTREVREPGMRGAAGA